MIELKVTGMTCGHCESAVNKALAAVAGVTRVVEVNREKNRVVVEGSADAQALIAVIKEEGYTAELAS
ncbi:MAG: heavy-metal-associated domain-containing protein [Proteobacteria bacterium]|nr:MAG: heavy-metal-associated domain-containing protein [Pseudomonadota bacterium]QKK10701.1 MAG: heavy-metal-associated domain-containing protein [Pseudomonadota bacterium]